MMVKTPATVKAPDVRDHTKLAVKGLLRTGLWALAPQAFMLDMTMLPPIVYDKPFTVERGVAVVEIRGTLTHHPEDPCLDSYDAVGERVMLALHSECAAVIMRIDSLGGDVAGCFDLARSIRSTATECGKRLYAYTDGTAASAAYAIACVADEIAVGVTGFVGSVGIINAILDQTAHDAAHGLRYGFATSGARKADGNPHTPITDEAMAALQEQVNDLASVFYTHVSSHRKLSEASVASLEAGLFFGEGAVKKRLADRVCSWGEMVSLAANPPPQAGTQQSEVATMPKYLEEAKKMAAKMVEDGDDADREMAKKMMALFGDGDAPEKKEAKAEGESEDKPKAEDEKKESEAKAGYAEGEGPDSEKMKAAAAASPLMVEVLRELHTMKAERVAEKAMAERQSLLSTRPDFDAKTTSWLRTAPIEQVRQAVASFPKIPASPAAASQTRGTQGAAQGSYTSADELLEQPPSMLEYIRERMGRSAKLPSGIVHAGRDTVFLPMTPGEARAALEKKGQ